MEWLREEYLELMTFGDPPRAMLVELFGPLVGLEEEWGAQGASEEELSLEAFDFDYVRRVWAPANAGMNGGFERKVIEETDEHRIERDPYGRTVRLVKGVATIAHPLDWPVRTMDDWLRFKPWFEYSDDRVDVDALAEAERARGDGALSVFRIPGAFDTPRQLMGEEGACLAYYEQPELMRDIVDTVRDTSVRVCRRVVEAMGIDVLSVHEDLAGKSGPLVGPKQVAEYFRPYFRDVWEIARGAGARLFQMDTDGNVNPIVDALLDCGLTTLLPMEPAAGMDVVALRERYGERLTFMGGIDKHVVRRGREAIDAELAYKLQPTMRKGAVFGLDHRIPNGTPLADYRYYVRRAREILGLEPLDESRRGWQRMAF